MYIKKFDEWNQIKQRVNAKKKHINIRAGDIRWMIFGTNIGSEIDGKGSLFIRPGLILSVMSHDLALVVPLTSKQKQFSGYMSIKFSNRLNSLCLLQIKSISHNRILRRLAHIPTDYMKDIKLEVGKYYGFLNKTALCSNVHTTMRILILGSQGMLGQELVAVGAAAGHEIFAWDKTDVDVTSPDAMEKIRAVAPEIIINAVAYNTVDDIEGAGWPIAEKINGELPGQLAAVAKELGATFIHFSSDYVFDGEDDAGYAEDATPSPVNAYGRSKLMGETAVQNAGGNFYLVRLSRLFGKPAVSTGAKRSFVDIMMELGRTKETINLVDEENGAPTYAPDLAVEVFKLVTEKAPFGIYHITNSGACTWFEFGKEIFRLTNSKIVASPVAASAFPRPAKRPRTSELLNTKRHGLRNWRDALRDYVGHHV